MVVDFTHTTLENRFSVSLKLHSPVFQRILHKTNKKFGDFSLNVDSFSLSQRVVGDSLWGHNEQSEGTDCSIIVLKNTKL